MLPDWAFFQKPGYKPSAITQGGFRLITLFESGRGIQEGDRFLARIDSIEGRRRVTLIKVQPFKPAWEMKTCPLCFEDLDNGKKHGSWCK